VQFFNCQWTLVGVIIGRYFGRVLTRGSAAIIGQRVLYGNALPSAVLTEEDELEQALALADE
jgi:hypothetical protein